MQRPVIGITCDHNSACTQYMLPHSYASAVEDAGGLPLLLPYRLDTSRLPQLLDLLDGIVFSGGNDLDPSAWSEPRHPQAVPVDPHRESFERALLAEVERRRMPTLGICLGSQLLNAHRGGSMHQFLPDLPRDPPLEHRRVNEQWGRHEVVVVPGSLLHRIVGAERISVNSSHKQATRDVGRGLVVVARADDGVIEGVEDPSLPFFLGVQWHPERITYEPPHRALFKALVDHAGASQHSRT
jgi:putative glutamine amidotransferase